MFVAFRDIAVPAESAQALEGVVRDRLGLVEGETGSNELQVWRSKGQTDPTGWSPGGTTSKRFKDYMRSSTHHRSHVRPGR